MKQTCNSVKSVSPMKTDCLFYYVETELERKNTPKTAFKAPIAPDLRVKFYNRAIKGHPKDTLESTGQSKKQRKTHHFIEFHQDP